MCWQSNLKIMYIVVNFWRQYITSYKSLLCSLSSSKKLTDCQKDQLFEKMYF
jgi:hypothetical protein